MEPRDPRTEFEAAVRGHVPALVSYLAALTRSRGRAEEIAQESLVRAYGAFHRFEGGGQPDRVGAWLRTIARNCWRNALRDERRARSVPFDAALEAGVSAFYDDADRRAIDPRTHLAPCFDLLPEALALPCRLHYVEEHPVRAVAERLHVSVDAALKRLQRARDLLRDCIRDRMRADQEPSR